MKPRDVKRPVHTGWPYVRVEGEGASFVLRIGGGPVQRGDLSSWVFERLQEASDLAQSAVTEDDDGRSKVAEAQAVIEGVYGWLIVWAWADPDAELEARTKYDASGYEATGPYSVRLDAGRDAVAELLDVVSWEAVQDIAKGIIGLLTRGRPDGQEVVELRPF